MKWNYDEVTMMQQLEIEVGSFSEECHERSDASQCLWGTCTCMRGAVDCTTSSLSHLMSGCHENRWCGVLMGLHQCASPQKLTPTFKRDFGMSDKVERVKSISFESNAKMLLYFIRSPSSVLHTLSSSLSMNSELCTVLHTSYAPLPCRRYTRLRRAR